MMTRLEKLQKELKAQKREVGHVDSISEDSSESSILKRIACFMLVATMLTWGACFFIEYAQPQSVSTDLVRGGIVLLLVVVLPLLITYFIFWLEKKKKGLNKMSVGDYIIEESRGDI